MAAEFPVVTPNRERCEEQTKGNMQTLAPAFHGSATPTAVVKNWKCLEWKPVNEDSTSELLHFLFPNDWI